MRKRSIIVVFAALVLVLMMAVAAHATIYEADIIENGWKSVRINGPDNMYVTQYITTWPWHFDEEGC
ncbi:MAG: hypothetical protein IIY88_05745, partial [Eubacterium sp.]|nr:hypothetical protein [Eubacterium sp.]